MIEANRAVTQGVIPGTGIFNSLLALNPPLYTYVLLLFARQPFGMTLLTALANVAGVVALYFFARRHFGTLVATVAGLLYATAGYAVYMSTFIWQQTILPPLIIAALILLFEGAARGRRYWLIPHVALVALLIQLYPVMASMLALTVVGTIMAWRTIRWWEPPLALVVGALFFLPTVLFEVASDGFDIPIYLAYLRAPKVLDTQVFSALGLAMGPVDQAILGPASLYADLAPTFHWLTPVILGLVYASMIWLALAILAPIPVALWRRSWKPIPDALRSHRWRAYLLLLLWPLAFLALTHSPLQPVYPHYVFVLLPGSVRQHGNLPRALPACSSGARCRSSTWSAWSRCWAARRPSRSSGGWLIPKRRRDSAARHAISSSARRASCWPRNCSRLSCSWGQSRWDGRDAR